MTPLTNEELGQEYNYRWTERLRLLAGDRLPTEAEKQLAYREVNDWLDGHEKETGS